MDNEDECDPGERGARRLRGDEASDGGAARPVLSRPSPVMEDG